MDWVPTHSQPPPYLGQEDPPEGIGDGSIHSNHIELHFLLSPAHHLHFELSLEPLQIPAVIVAMVVAREVGAVRLSGTVKIALMCARALQHK